MQIKKIFLASSAELKEDREAFERMLARLNPQWRGRDIIFDLIVWENFIDAMSPAGLQKEYNKAVEECDVFVMLFFTKVGTFTLEEFETAFADLATGKGRKVKRASRQVRGAILSLAQDPAPRNVVRRQAPDGAHHPRVRGPGQGRPDVARADSATSGTLSKTS